MPNTKTVASDKAITTPILVYSHSVMPYHGVLGTSFFEGSNVPNFFDQYSQIWVN